MLPDWYRDRVDERTRPEAAIELAADFLAAPEGERQAVRAAWDPHLTWTLPNPWRLACVDEDTGSPAERITAALVFQALAMSSGDERDAIVGLAILFNSAALARLDPFAVFERVAAAFPGREGDTFRRFAARRPEDRSLAAFLLSASAQEGGGFEIRPSW
ncbi:MAG TPA: hypothetical protein VK698_33805 [Kofleriaceae bacterium]|nr:hypothetical protein [Kofleriaceae bacterium]